MFASAAVFFVNVSIPRCGREYRCVVLSASGNIAAWCVRMCVYVCASGEGVVVVRCLPILLCLPHQLHPRAQLFIHLMRQEGIRLEKEKHETFFFFRRLTAQCIDAAAAYVAILMMSDLYLCLNLMNRMSGVQLMRKALVAELWNSFVCVSLCVGV